MKRRRLVIGASAAASAGVGSSVALAPLAAEPDGEKNCGSALPPAGSAQPAIAVQQEPPIAWKQKGGTVNDASCLSRTAVAGVLAPRSEKEVAAALGYARATGLTVAPAGVRHSMGGQALPRGGLLLDMRGLNRIELDAAKSTVTPAKTSVVYGRTKPCG